MRSYGGMVSNVERFWPSWWCWETDKRKKSASASATKASYVEEWWRQERKATIFYVVSLLGIYFFWECRSLCCCSCSCCSIYSACLSWVCVWMRTLAFLSSLLSFFTRMLTTSLLEKGEGYVAESRATLVFGWILAALLLLLLQKNFCRGI